jgi:GTPase SAR1 family protein
LIGDKKIHVQYYVVPGNQFYQSLSSRLVSGFPVTLFVFDVNEAETLDAVQDWMEDVRPRNARPRLWTPMNFLIGNKTDTPGTRIILSSEGQKAAEELEMKYYETS